MRARRSVCVLASVLLASLVVVASPVRAGVRRGEGALALAAWLMFDDAPSYAFPGATRGEPLGVNVFGANTQPGGFRLTVEPLVAPTTSGITMRIAFYPAGDDPWGLQWKSGGNQAELVTQDRAGTPGTTVDALPKWSGSGSTRQVTIDANIVTIRVPQRFLDRADVKLSDRTAVQLQSEASSGGTVTFQGSPVVDWGALLGRHGGQQLPPVGIVYDANLRAMPWVVAPVCDDCDQGSSATLLGESTPTGPRILVTLRGWPTSDIGVVDQIRAFDDADDDLSSFHGALCQVGPMRCDLFTGNDHDAEITGETPLATSQQGNQLGFTIVGGDWTATPTRTQYEVLFAPTAGASTSVAVRTPWSRPTATEPAPPSTDVLAPDEAKDLFLTADAAEKLGYTSDPTEITTTTDVNQLPTAEEARTAFGDAGFQAEHVLFYTVPGIDPNTPSEAESGTTVFGSESVDVFADAKGAQAAKRELDREVKASEEVEVVQQGRGDKPTIIQVTGGGQTTTTAYVGAQNVVIVVRTVCSHCSDDQAEDSLRPLLRAVLNLRDEKIY